MKTAMLCLVAVTVSGPAAAQSAWREGSRSELVTVRDGKPVNEETALQLHPPVQATDARSRSPLVAALLSVGVTGVPPILGAYFVNEGPEDLGVAIYLGSIMLGPSVGALYAGETRHAVRHFVIAGGMFTGFWWSLCGTSTPWGQSCNVEAIPHSGPGALAFAGGYIANWIWGLATGVADAKRYNERLRVSIVPLRGGHLGLAASVRF